MTPAPSAIHSHRRSRNRTDAPARKSLGSTLLPGYRRLCGRGGASIRDTTFITTRAEATLKEANGNIIAAATSLADELVRTLPAVFAFLDRCRHNYPSPPTPTRQEVNAVVFAQSAARKHLPHLPARTPNASKIKLVVLAMRRMLQYRAEEVRPLCDRLRVKGPIVHEIEDLAPRYGPDCATFLGLIATLGVAINAHRANAQQIATLHALTPDQWDNYRRMVSAAPAPDGLPDIHSIDETVGLGAFTDPAEDPLPSIDDDLDTAEEPAQPPDQDCPDTTFLSVIDELATDISLPGSDAAEEPAQPPDQDCPDTTFLPPIHIDDTASATPLGRSDLPDIDEICDFDGSAFMRLPNAPTGPPTDLDAAFALFEAAAANVATLMYTDPKYTNSQ
jgi:hypothetical protein